MAIDAVLVSRITIAALSGTTATGTTTNTGDVFVVFQSYDSGSTSVTPTDSVGNTYSVAAGGSQSCVTLGDRYIAYISKPGDAGYVGGGSNHTVTSTFTGSNSASVVHFFRVTGASSTPLDIELKTFDSNGSPWTITTGTLSQANEVILTLCGSNVNGGSTITYVSSNTTIVSQESDANNWWTSAVSKLIVSATTSITPSFTSGTSTEAVLIVLTFKEGAGSAPTLTSLDRTRATAGGTGFTLTVNGTGFDSSAVVDFGGVALATTYVSATQVTASVTSTQLASAVVTTVVAANTGSADSNALEFIVDPVPSGYRRARTVFGGFTTGSFGVLGNVASVQRRAIVGCPFTEISDGQLSTGLKYWSLESDGSLLERTSGGSPLVVTDDGIRTLGSGETLLI